ncbi:MAG TPA: sarcosine oxidase subunit delta, partial [Streptosporangiaceae bacterium]
CGERDASEFRYVSEMLPRPDPETATTRQWRDYLYLRGNKRGWVTERWYHRAGCRRYLVLERDTSTDKVRRQPR